MDDQEMILVIENEENWQDILGLLLEPEGFQVRIAASFEEAKHQLEVQAFHLAILDIRLDEKPGSALDEIQMTKSLQELQKHKDGMNVVVVTGHGTVPLTRDAFKEFHVLDFVQKERLDHAEFKKLVKDGARSTAMARKTSALGFRIQGLLGNTMFEDIALDFAPELDADALGNELAGLVAPLLSDYHPLTEHPARISQSNRGIHILTWSRGRGTAVTLRIERRQDGTQAVNKLPGFFNTEQRSNQQKSHSTRNLVGAVYALPDLPFEQFNPPEENK